MGNAALSQSDTGLGGALYQLAGSLAINSTDFQDNKASSGGALALGADSAIIAYLLASNFTGHSASVDGGVLYAALWTNGSLEVDSCVFANNSAGSSGGAFYLLPRTAGPSINYRSSFAAANRAGQAGGMLYLAGRPSEAAAYICSALEPGSGAAPSGNVCASSIRALEFVLPPPSYAWPGQSLQFELALRDWFGNVGCPAGY